MKRSRPVAPAVGCSTTSAGTPTSTTATSRMLKLAPGAKQPTVLPFNDLLKPFSVAVDAQGQRVSQRRPALSPAHAAGPVMDDTMETMSAFARRSVLIAITATAVIAGAAGCGTSNIAHQTTSAAASAKATTPRPPQGQSTCTDLNGTVGPDQTCHVRSATSTYEIDMSFPLDYPDPQAVGDFLKQHRDEFIDWVAKFGPDGRGRPYQYDATAEAYRSGTPDSGTQSLVLDIDNDTGLANQGHPNTTFRAFNFDLAKHAPITFDTLFKPGTKPLEVLNPIIERELGAPSADLNEKTYQAFAITDNAVIFFFGQNQVLQDNRGPHRVVVPRTELASLLA
jgi:hypothetical protein